jgi:glycosyltransferase involved in cell wall biosynthesis
LAKIMIIGGAGRSLINFRGELIDEWLRLGYEVAALAAPPTDEIVQKLVNKGVEFRPIPLERDTINPFKDFKAFKKIFRVIKEEKPDYLFAYTVKPVIYASIAGGFIPGTKIFSMITGLGYAFAGHSLKQRILNRLLKFLYKYALKKNETVFFQNPDDIELFKKWKLITIDQKSIVVDGSGVNINHFYYSQVKRKEIIAFLFIGRMLKSKGIFDYVQAAELIKSNYDNVTFTLVGPTSNGPDGICRSHLKRWVENGLVIYHDWTSDVRPYIDNCSVFVLPSFYREGVPRSVLEAMSMGRPIITTDAPGCRETVEEGKNGFLIPIRDSEALAAVMERFILNPDLIEEMGNESRRIVEEKFDVHKVNLEILRGMNLM